jgi:hypothetical protein
MREQTVSCRFTADKVVIRYGAGYPDKEYQEHRQHHGKSVKIKNEPLRQFDIGRDL